ncbi:hypothetical protein D9M68_947260 [compost metagenome]
MLMDARPWPQQQARAAQRILKVVEHLMPGGLVLPPGATARGAKTWGERQRRIFCVNQRHPAPVPLVIGAVEMLLPGIGRYPLQGFEQRRQIAAQGQARINR